MLCQYVLHAVPNVFQEPGICDRSGLQTSRQRQIAMNQQTWGLHTRRRDVLKKGLLIGICLHVVHARLRPLSQMSFSDYGVESLPNPSAHWHLPPAPPDSAVVRPKAPCPLPDPFLGSQGLRRAQAYQTCLQQCCHALLQLAADLAGSCLSVAETQLLQCAAPLAASGIVYA